MRRRAIIQNKLKSYRELAGYTQKQVATLLGFSTTGRISEWENGYRFPGVVNLIKLAVLYGTQADNFYLDLREAIRSDLCRENPPSQNTRGWDRKKV